MDMKQQLDPQQLVQKSLWLHQVEDDEEEEVDVGLLARHSRHPTDGVGTTPCSSTAASASGELQPAEIASAHATGTTIEHSGQEEEEAAVAASYRGHRQEEVGGDNKQDEVVSVEGHGNSVYFDELQGKWKCRHCNWIHQIGSPCILDVQNPNQYLHMAMGTKTLNQWGPSFGLETKGTESITGISEMQSGIPKIQNMEINQQREENLEDQSISGLSPAMVERVHEEANTSFKHFENETKVDTNVDLFGDIEEDLMELDVERVLAKQNTHDLYCPKCNSCITRKVILIRRKPKISKIHKPKRGQKLDPILNSAGLGRIDDAPETHSNVSPVAASDEQNNGREQEQEAFSCLSCFSIFIPIGNGCFKIFQFFRRGWQTEHTPRLQEIKESENTQRPVEIRQRENIQSPQRINLSENTQSPQEISQGEVTETPPTVSDNEDVQSSQKGSRDAIINSLQHKNYNEDAHEPQNISHNEDTQSPQKRSHNANMDSPQHLSYNEDAQKTQLVSHNEDIQSPQEISRSENIQSHQVINQNESKKIPQKMPTGRTNWIFSIFAFPKAKETVEKAGHASSVQSAAVPTPSVINREYIDGAAIKPKEPGIRNTVSSTNSSLLDYVTDSMKKKPDAKIFKRNVGDNEIKDLEAGLLEPTSRTEVAPLSGRRTQTERRGADSGEAREWEILKSIVYGGLIESITSLGVVSSAAGAGADTLNVLALGLANLIGGLLIIFHNLRELKKDQPRGASTEINVEEDRYQALLGRRQNFVLHATVAILSFLVFGLIPPVVYGFSFRNSDDKDLKLAAVAGASLVCIILLALGKGHVRNRTYFRSVSYHVVLGVTASGISYLVGELIRKLLEQLGLFESSSAISVPFLETIPMEVGRASS